MPVRLYATFSILRQSAFFGHSGVGKGISMWCCRLCSQILTLRHAAQRIQRLTRVGQRFWHTYTLPGSGLTTS
eukprot:COSAG02_NODE_11787_length_1654_cov_1.927974_1_plen_73_part_00